MIITRTPFRMSFFGGGTDLASFYEKHGGAVLSTTFDKYCYVNIRHLSRFFDYKTHLTYSKTEYINAVDEIQHPLIREAMRFLDIRAIRLMDYSWKLKRGLSEGISTSAIDDIYAAVLKAGATGGKFLGAGGGGFLLFYVEQERQAAVWETLKDFLYVPFRFETGGPQVVHYTAEDYDIA